MKQANLVIDELKNNQYDSLLRDVYVDEHLIEGQRERYIKAIEMFISLYGNKEIEIYSTPGRSEVSGNHTDHQHGQVLAAAINLDIIAVVAKRDNEVKVVSDDYDIENIHISDLERREEEKELLKDLYEGF